MSMNEVVLIEDGCCHAGQLDPFVAFLRERLGEEATVTLYGVGGHLGFSAVPVELGERLLAQGANSVPVLAVNGDLLYQGELPEWETALGAVQERLRSTPLSGGAS